MKLKNALKKIIHSVCLISVLFLSVFFVLPPVESYAESHTVTITLDSPSSNGICYFWLYDSDNNLVVSKGGNNLSFTVALTENATYSLAYRFDKLAAGQISSIRSFIVNNIAYTTYQNRNDALSHIYDIYNDDNASLFISYTSISWVSSSNLGDAYKFIAFTYHSGSEPTPTPTPAPATPTPTVSTPTPDANAEAFFGKLGSDAQNGVGAIMTAWTAANSHFYTSVLFIVLPVFLGIVGLIASFFFGGGDDD